MSRELVTFWDYKNKAEETENAIAKIPMATLESIRTTSDATNPKNFMAVVLNETAGKRIVATVSKRYRLVQHAEAFKPIIDGLHFTATDYEFCLIHRNTKATLDVFVTEIANSGLGGIRLGFRAISNIDGRNAIKYTLSQSKFQGTIEIVGYRQVCENGMKIRVPLDEAEFVRPEIRGKVTSLLEMSANVAHIGNVESKIKATQYVVEAMSLLKEPVKAMIEKARTQEIGEKEAKALLAKYIGKRLTSAINDKFQSEEQNLWGLYNAITYIASHGVTVSTMNGLMNKSANLLERELLVPTKK
jgi:hypothetical protein